MHALLPYTGEHVEHSTVVVAEHSVYGLQEVKNKKHDSSEHRKSHQWVGKVPENNAAAESTHSAVVMRQDPTVNVIQIDRHLLIFSQLAQAFEEIDEFAVGHGRVRQNAASPEQLHIFLALQQAPHECGEGHGAATRLGHCISKAMRLWKTRLL
uniref:Uncharacterized protein n=1 Tax=Ananas comosus var. bracteatus TaxID=296719 RepID=A0A6V7P0M5_ANACO|nr:unnamed protein product [Ananas comosus var. bracteatus]